MERVRGYRVVRKLATGGTSDVLLAKAEGPRGFERTVVLKLLRAQQKNDEELAMMFAREAAAYARLSHPAIVRLFDFFAIGDEEAVAGGPEAGQLCMVLEHVDGPPLSRLRSMLKAISRELDDRAAIFIAAQIFDALAAAHAASDETGMIAPVIHRDVNPSNVLLPWDGHVKLADFGVAKVTGLTQHSAAGIIKGTYGYMAPEQVTGDPITPRADVYAAGIVLWELLAKRRAFHRGALPEVEALRAMAEPRLASIDTIRPDVERTVREALSRALEPRAERRTITAEEMVAILHDSVSMDEGRELLASALSAVRHDPQAAMAAASIPPTPALSMTPRPSAALAPRPAAGTSPKPPSASPAQSSDATPPAGKVAPRPPPSSGKLPKPVPPPRMPPIRDATDNAHSAATVPVGPPAAEESIRHPVTDSMLQEVGVAVGPISDGALASAALKQAISEVLRASPAAPIQISEAPLDVEPPRRAPVLPPDLPKLSDRNTEETSTLVLNRAGAASDTPPAAPEPPQDFASAVREVESAQALTVSPPAQPAAQPVGPPPLPPLTAPMARPVPPPIPPMHAPPPLPPPVLAPSTPHPMPPAMTTESIPPERSRGRRVVVAVLLGLGVTAGVVSVFSYMGYRRTATVPPAPSASVAQATPSASAARVASSASAAPPVASVEPSASAAASASAAPVASVVAAPASAEPAASVAPAASAAPAASSAAPAADVPEGMGLVKTTGAIPGRRIFVDERTLGQTPETVTVKCGSHTVKLGSAGKPQSVDVPCGGEVTVTDRPAN